MTTITSPIAQKPILSPTLVITSFSFSVASQLRQKHTRLALHSSKLPSTSNTNATTSNNNSNTSNNNSLSPDLQLQ